MKSFILITTIISGILLSSCNQKKIDQLQAENQKLSEQTHLQDSLLDDFMASMNKFQDNLNLIKERENLVELNAQDAEMRKENKDQINDDLMRISALLDQNKQIIAELEQKVKRSSGRTSQLRRSIAQLNKQMEEKDLTLAELTERITNMDVEIQTLSARGQVLRIQKDSLIAINDMKTVELEEQVAKIEEQSNQISEQVTEMNTAYFVTGSKRELKSMDILESKKRVNADFDPAGFTKVDITQLNVIPVEAKKVKVLTQHPSDAYTLVSENKRVTGIEILNPDEFWKASKYLVVVVD